MVIGVYETKEFYHDGISENDFIKYALSSLGCIEIPKPLYDYYAEIYKFHVAKTTHDEVYARTDGQAYKNLYNYMVEQYKPGMTRIEFQNHLFPGFPPGGGNPAERPKWVNILIKIIVIILEDFDK